MALLSKQGRIISLLVIDSAFFLLEVIIGYAVHSLALVADSFHMLNDVFSLVVALWAVKVANSRAASSEYSYGWQRAEILGALVNGVFLLALCLTIFLEALQRFVEPQVITNPQLVLGVGCAGLVSNLVGLVLFHEHGHSHSHGDEVGHSAGRVDSTDAMEIGALLPGAVVQESLAQQRLRAANLHSPTPSEYEAARAVDEHTSLLSGHGNGHSHSHGGSGAPSFTSSKSKKKPVRSTQSLNMRGVFLHVMGDALGNVGVIATALFIWLTDYSWRFYFDPLISLVITIIIFSSALPLVKSASKILLQGAPKGIDMVDVKDEILSLQGVKSVHDFHIWILRENLFIASLHVAVSVSADEFMELSRRIRSCLHGYGIHSATIQPEFEDTPLSNRSSAPPSVHGDLSANGDYPLADGGMYGVMMDGKAGPGEPSCLCVDGCAEAACCVKNGAAANGMDDGQSSHSH
ncbi:cation efflux protein [Lipomyces tetrasporus]|uniref:Cation efflux protein n=1 Tax=Lipomyces tetrasporus TaxID=54092 RepID=A0AAD7QQG4_9ASCO|nr:cation efflux protein [Lipomyces tetrasporus]KAJ8099375.1 cation efflux protein [Lipomyces tetrasporus]